LDRDFDDGCMPSTPCWMYNSFSSVIGDFSSSSLSFSHLGDSVRSFSTPHRMNGETLQTSRRTPSRACSSEYSPDIRAISHVVGSSNVKFFGRSTRRIARSASRMPFSQMLSDCQRGASRFVERGSGRLVSPSLTFGLVHL